MSQPRPEIGARLHHLCIRSPDPRRLAAFFEAGFGMTIGETGHGWHCRAPERDLLIVAGRRHSTVFHAFAFADAEALTRHRERLASRGVAVKPGGSPLFDDRAYSVVDPDGNRAVFGMARKVAAIALDAPRSARLQHVVYRSVDLDAMVDHYADKLGFTVSDRVKDAGGVLRACFMRSDLEHHSLAIFRAPESRLDHHSYETGTWGDIRDWADHLARKDIPIVWGVGRHGPGDDLFFMVRDPDENLVEISAEIEQCVPERPSGLWPHAERTLNVWGNAILRS